MGEDNKTEPKTEKGKQSKFRFLIPEEKQMLREPSEEFYVNNKNITFNSNVDLTVQFESRGYDTQRYNIKKLVHERLYETQVFDLSSISQAIVETINEIEEKGVESFKELEVVDDYEFENNENYERSLNILVTEVERKQYTEHVELDEEAFKEQSQIIKNELERILRNNAYHESRENFEEDETSNLNNNLSSTGFNILLAEDERYQEESINDEYFTNDEEIVLDLIGNFDKKGNDTENVRFPLIQEIEQVEEIEVIDVDNEDNEDLLLLEKQIKTNNVDVNQTRQQNQPIKHLNHVYEEVRKPKSNEEVEVETKTVINNSEAKLSNQEISNTANDLNAESSNIKERHYINFDDELESSDEDNIEKYIDNYQVELKLLNDDELEALSERSYLTKKSVETSKSTSFANNISLDEEKRIQASKFFSEQEEYVNDTSDTSNIKTKVFMNILIGLMILLIFAILFFGVRIAINIYESKSLDYQFENMGERLIADTPVVDGVTSDYTAVVEIVSNNAINDVKEVTNEGFTYNTESAVTEYFDDFVYANLRNKDFNYITLYGKDDNNHFGSIKYLGDEDFFNTLKVKYSEGNVVTEYSTIGYYKITELNRHLENAVTQEDFNKYLARDLAMSEHSKGIALTSDSKVLSLTTYDTQDKLYHVAHFIGN